MNAEIAMTREKCRISGILGVAELFDGRLPSAESILSSVTGENGKARVEVRLDGEARTRPHEETLLKTPHRRHC